MGGGGEFVLEEFLLFFLYKKPKMLNVLFVFFFCFFRLFSLTGDNSNDDDRPLAADFVLFLFYLPFQLSAAPVFLISC